MSLADALAVAKALRLAMDEARWEEDKHPRRKDGKFGTKGSGSGASIGSSSFQRKPGERPVATIRRLANAMPNKSRREIINMAVAAGVHPSTASVQYSAWQRQRAAQPQQAATPEPTPKPPAVAAALGRIRAATLAAREAVARPEPAPTTPAPVPVSELKLRPGERPVAGFHRIATALGDRPRSEIIATAVTAGINRSTASTQYSVWQRNTRSGSTSTARAPVSTRTNTATTTTTPTSTAAAPRTLIKDTSRKVPPPGHPYHEFHKEIHNAASAFKGASIEIVYGFDDDKPARFRITREDGVTINRNFNGDTVDHSYFQIPASERRTGAAKAFLSESVAAYKKAGYKKITVHANIDVGGYAWLRYGFKPDPSSVNKLKDRVTDCVEGLERFRTALGPDGIKSVKELVAAGNLHAIASITTPVQLSNGTITPFGRAVFLGTDWYGKLHLTDAKQMAIFESYSNKSKD